MDGFLLINKEKDYTSHDVCNLVKKRFNTKKVGHCGTLDPFASGLLILGINKATKALAYLEKESKQYLATITFGSLTDSKDITGKIVATKPIVSFTEKKLNDVINEFIGEQEQIPPMLSAIKVEGKKLYEYYRRNIEVEVKPRKMTIYDIKIINYNIQSLTLLIDCSKGTYIRSLGEDIAKALDNYGYLSALCRKKIGKYDLSNAYSIEQIKNMSELSLLSTISAFTIPYIILHEEEIRDVKNGKRFFYDGQEKEILLIDANNNAIAVYIKEKDNQYKCLRGLF